MNLQLFGYDDGYYYGQCKLICEVETLEGNGKVVSVTDGTNSYSATIVDKIASFLLPPTNKYTVNLINDGSIEFTKDITLGYGECVHLMLADGYDPILQKDKLTFEEIMAKSEGLGSYVPDAQTVKIINDDLLCACKLFTEGSGANTKYYIQKGADSASKKLLGSDFTAVFIVYAKVKHMLHSQAWGWHDDRISEVSGKLTVRCINGNVTSTITENPENGYADPLEYSASYDTVATHCNIERVELVSITFGE